MRLKELALYHLKIPFKIRFRHAKREYDGTDNLIAKLIAEDGKEEVIGFGECIPRMDVTGEAIESAAKKAQMIFERIKNREFRNAHDIRKHLDSSVKEHTVARCAIELALFDAMGKAGGKNISDYIGRNSHNEARYSAVVSHLPIWKTYAFAFMLRGLDAVKIKAGFPDDAARVRAVRQITGNKTRIFLDANEAWSAEEAISKINELEQYDIAAVEQPLKKDDLAGMKMLKERTKIPLMADESLCSIKDAEMLCKSRLFDIFNVRISKCGGIFNSQRIIDLAKKNGIKIYMGCHVGETGILSAAGRALALSNDFIACEGSYGKHLLSEDIVKEDVSFDDCGRAKPLNGHGLGVTVDEKRLEKYGRRI